MAMLCVGGGAHAGSLHVSPVRLELPAGAHAVALTLRNEDDAPLFGQIRLFKWTQTIDEDHLEPTTELVASPPIAEIAPHTD